MEDINKNLTKLLNMLKLIFATLLLIFVIIVIGVSKMYSTGEDNYTNNGSDSEYNTNYDVSMFKEISASEIKKETKGKKKVIYIGRETCGWCAAFLPNLWDAQDEYDFKTLYIDIAKIINFDTGAITDQKASNILSELTGEGYETFMEENLGTTPMILIVKDNKILGATTGYYEYEEFKNLLDDMEI